MVYVLLIRHGETVDNIANKYAGSTDSPLTSHGRVQAGRLASHLTRRFHPTHVFASDLRRASTTAQTLLAASPPNAHTRFTVAPELRERDFGTLEGTVVTRAPPAAGALGWRAPESYTAMAVRADRFLHAFLVPAVVAATAGAGARDAVVVVSHGVFLRVLWERLARACGRVAWQAAFPERGAPVWGNTAVMRVRLLLPPERRAGTCKAWTAVVETVNDSEHLAGLRRTRGGVGSAAYQSSQRRVEEFFSRRPRAREAGLNGNARI